MVAARNSASSSELRSAGTAGTAGSDARAVGSALATEGFEAGAPPPRPRLPLLALACAAVAAAAAADRRVASEASARCRSSSAAHVARRMHLALERRRASAAHSPG